MSHQEEGSIEYADTCRIMLDHASERIDCTIETMESLIQGSSLVIDDGIREMMRSLVETADDVKAQIAERRLSLGSSAFAYEIGETRKFLSVVNSVVLRADALNSAVTEARDRAIASGRDLELESRLSDIADGDLRRMMALLSRNPAHSDLGFDELRSLAECRLDPSKKVKRSLVRDTVSDIRKAMTTEKVAEEAIAAVVGSSPDVSPLEMMDAATSEIMDERLRRSAVKAIVGCIVSKGFVVRKEDIRHIRETDTVKIMAMKPRGQKAEFSIDLHGRFIYHFQGYEGRACEKDIGPMEEDLERIYGIKLTDKKTLWSNPDKEGKQHHMEMKVRRN